MKEYASLPLRAEEEVIEEFSVSKKYTFLLICIGILILILSLITFLNIPIVTTLFRDGAGVLAPLFANLIWIALLIVGLYVAGMGVYLQLAYRYFLSNQRVIEQEGFFAQRTASSDYEEINDIVVRQDFINRLILGTGTVGMTTPGTASEEYQLLNIDQPVQRRELIRDLIRATKEGHDIDKYMIAHLMAHNGFEASEQAALDALDTSVGKSPVAEATFGEISPAFQRHLDEFHEGKLLTTAGADPTTTPHPTANTQESDRIPTTENIQALATPSEQSVGQNLVLDPVSGEMIEDLHGDGVDDSDRIRHAQKKIASNTTDSLIDSDDTDTK